MHLGIFEQVAENDFFRNLLNIARGNASTGRHLTLTEWSGHLFDTTHALEPAEGPTVPSEIEA